MPEALRLADEWWRKTQSEAGRRNSAYDHYGMDNTPENVDPLGAKMAAELRRLHSDAKDAERYRWLRTQIERQRLVIAESCGWYGLKSWSGDDPDKHIDAAIDAATGKS